MQANQSASKLLDIIVENFPSFNDVHDFHDRKGWLYGAFFPDRKY